MRSLFHSLIGNDYLKDRSRELTQRSELKTAITPAEGVTSYHGQQMKCWSGKEISGRLLTMWAWGKSVELLKVNFIET